MNLTRWWNWFSTNKSGKGRASLGNRGEQRAAKFLKKLGYKILTRSMRNPAGEIDIVARDGKVIVFVEVKTRESTIAGHPEEAVTMNKQHRISRTAAMFLKYHRLSDSACRFDVIAILWPAGEKPQIKHIKHAFESTI